MQPDQIRTLAEAERSLCHAMERIILEVRTLWFGAWEVPCGAASRVVEPSGELFMFVDGSPGEVDEIILRATERGAYVVATSFAHPRDLTTRLRRANFRTVQRFNAYVWERAGEERASTPAEPPTGLGLLRRLLRRPQPAITVRPIGPEELPLWNRVCWRAFGRRGGEEASLREKEHAFRQMGERGRWYLAMAGDRPVGTAILFQGAEGAQVLAVGTDPGLRGRGVATAVMRRLIQDWEAHGHGFLFLDTHAGSSAEQLYRKLGFRWTYMRELFAPQA